MMVDQMRWDYLYKYRNRYGEGGFERLIRDGFSCENTMIKHAPTITTIGHSSVWTGSVSAIHGIAGKLTGMTEWGDLSQTSKIQRQQQLALPPNSANHPTTYW